MTSRAEQSRAIRVCYPFVGNNVGGSHISTLMLVTGLDSDDVEPIVVLHEEGALAGYLRQRGLGYELIDIPQFFAPPYWSRGNVVKLATQTWRLAAFLRRARVDIVHANDVRIHFGWTLAARLAGAKLIWHQRTGSFGSSVIKLALARMAQRIVCISHYTATTLPRQLVPQVQVVANPFDVGWAAVNREAERRKVLAELDLAADTRLVGFFGNLVQQKRPEVFLRAAAEIAARCNGPLAFLLFGAERHGAQAKLTRLANDLGIGRLVHLMGFRAPVEPWMAACELIVAPGVGEGLGRSLVEAMIVGTPVVAADSGGHREVVEEGETGLLAAADDATAFAAAACRLLNDNGLAATMAKRAQAHAIRSYSCASHAKAMTAIYVESLGRAPAPGARSALPRASCAKSAKTSRR